MNEPTLTPSEKYRHVYHDRKAKARHHEIVCALNEFTVFAMELMKLEGTSDKANRRVIYHVGKLRRNVLRNSSANVAQNLHAGEAIEKLQKAVRHIKSKL